MQTISVSDPLFARLQKHAIPFLDTPETVITRAVDALEAGREPSAVEGDGRRDFNPAAPPNLAFTTPTKIVLEGKVLEKSNTYWNNLMVACIRKAAEDGVIPSELSALMVIPHAIGRKEGGGYFFIEDAGVSVQGQSANGAWKQVYRIVSAKKYSLDVEFFWQNEEKASMPNAKGRFHFDP